ncbi:MAG: extracellular solute-binding protein [Clostridia bacterium]|nr:extracellular solute-binding protein [Clostridia bacterium]
MKGKVVKFLSFLIIIVMVFTLVVGCGGSGDKTDDGTTNEGQKDSSSNEEGAESGEEVTLSALLWCPDWPEEAQQIMDAFTEKYPNIKVDFQPMSTGGSIMEALQPKVNSDSLPDFMSVNGDEFGAKLADEGYLLDVSDLDAWDNTLDSLKPEWISKEKEIPFGISGGLCTTLIYYNKDMFKEAGIDAVPENWDEFQDACKKLKDAGLVPMVFGGANANDLANGPISYGLAQNIMGKNPNFKEEIADGTIDLNTPEMADVFEKLKYVPDNGYAQEGYMSMDYIAGNNAFVQGQGAMYFNGTWLANDLINGPDFEVGVFLPPWNPKGEEKIPVASSETGFAISARSEHVEEAKKLMEFFMGEGYNIYQNKRMCVPHMEADKIKVNVELADQITEVMDELSSYETTVPLYFAYLPANVTGNIQKIIQEVLIGDKTSEQAAKQVDDLVKEAAK